MSDLFRLNVHPGFFKELFSSQQLVVFTKSSMVADGWRLSCTNFSSSLIGSWEFWRESCTNQQPWWHVDICRLPVWIWSPKIGHTNHAERDGKVIEVRLQQDVFEHDLVLFTPSQTLPFSMGGFLVSNYFTNTHSDLHPWPDQGSSKMP